MKCPESYISRTAVPVMFPPDDLEADPAKHGGAWVPWRDCIFGGTQGYAYDIGLGYKAPPFYLVFNQFLILFFLNDK